MAASVDHCDEHPRSEGADTLDDCRLRVVSSSNFSRLLRCRWSGLLCALMSFVRPSPFAVNARRSVSLFGSWLLTCCSTCLASVAVESELRIMSTISITCLSSPSLINCSSSSRRSLLSSAADTHRLRLLVRRPSPSARKTLGLVSNTSCTRSFSRSSTSTLNRSQPKLW